MKDEYIISIGVWGQRHYNYLKIKSPTVINVMSMNSTLEQYLQNIDNDAQKKVYNYLKNHPKATIKVMVSECNISDGYVRKILTFLKENGYVKHEGSNKSGVWAIMK